MYNTELIDEKIIAEVKLTASMMQRKNFDSVIADFPLESYRKSLVSYKQKIQDDITTKLVSFVNEKLDIGATREVVEQALFNSGVEFTFSLFGDVNIIFSSTSFLDNLITAIDEMQNAS